MTEKKRFLERMKTEIDELEGRIDHLKLQANLGKMDARDKGRALIDSLERRLNTMRHKLAEIRNATEDKWTDLEGGAKAAWSDVKQGFKEATEHFRK